MDDGILEFCREKLDEMLGDPMLCDINPDITVEELNALIGLEYGQTMSLKINRADDESYSVIVSQNATVYDLKKAVQNAVNTKLSCNNGPKHVSWKYVWRNYWLYFNGQKLKDNKLMLKEYGIRGKDELCFIKRLTEK